MIPFVFINDHHRFCRIENRLETGRRASRAASEETGMAVVDRDDEWPRKWF